MDTFKRINSILNNSLDPRSTDNDPWADIVNNNKENIGNGINSKNRMNVDGGLPLGRLLAQTYSYSSDSSSSPCAQAIHASPPQLGNRNGNVFNYGLDSPLSTSGSAFSYSTGSNSSSSRRTGCSDPGSPTLDDAILMGCLSDSPFSPTRNINVSKTDITDLMGSLTLGSGNSLSSGLSNLPMNGLGNRSSQNYLSNASSTIASSGIPNSALDSSNLPSGLSIGSPELSSLSHCSAQASNDTLMLPNITRLQNMWLNQFGNQTLSDSTSSILGNNLRGSIGGGAADCSLSPLLSSADPYAIEKAAKLHRNAAASCDANCTWSGQLPQRIHKNSLYSCKVFLGGVPWDVTEIALHQAFMQFGNIQVEWPGKDNSSSPPRGYVYILFENEKQVRALISSCTQDVNVDNYYFKISSRRLRQKEQVQVIPWVISDSNYVRCPSYQLDPAKTVFVGALHGMLSAEGLAKIMNDLFGGVVYSGIDTDKYKYPIGSGRVTFNNEQSYKKAVKAAFIDIRTPKFNKKVQVDPYLADSTCQVCGMQQGPYFCRDETCFKYYCRSCWQIIHPSELSTHKPLMRNSKLRTQTHLRFF